MSIESVYRVVLVFNIVLGDFTFLIKSNDPKCWKTILANIPICLNILFNVYKFVFDFSMIFQTLGKLRLLFVVLMCFNMWTVVALIFHLAFRNKFSRMIYELAEVDKKLADYHFHFDYKFQKNFIIFILFLLIFITILHSMTIVLFVSPMKGVELAVIPFISWVTSNLTICCVFLSTYTTSKFIAFRFNVLNYALVKSFHFSAELNPRKLIHWGEVKSVKGDELSVCQMALVYEKLVRIAEQLNHCFSMQVHKNP